LSSGSNFRLQRNIIKHRLGLCEIWQQRAVPLWPFGSERLERRARHNPGTDGLNRAEFAGGPNS
jgi:hypothetical protein